MRTTRAVYLFELNKFMRSYRLLIPFLFMISYLSFAYSSGPISIHSSYGLSSLVVFLLMLLVGIRFDDINFTKIEETIIVKISEKEKFYIGRFYLLAGIAFFYAVLATFWPFFADFVYRFFKGVGLFTRPIVANDLISGYVMFFFTALCGGMGGLFLNIRILRKKELVILATVIYGFVTVVKGPINEYLTGINLFTWILPPVYDLSNAYSHSEHISWSDTWFLYLRIISYALSETIVYILIMAKKGFD